MLSYQKKPYPQDNLAATPYNTRKTCSSMLKKYGVDATYQKLILGHEGFLDLTERTYTYVDVAQLVEAVNKIPSVDIIGTLFASS